MEHDNLEQGAQLFGEADIVKHFMGLKRQYAQQREPLENDWDEALRAYYNSEDLRKHYEGYADVRVPEVDKKVNGVVSRIESILFNVTRLGRIEPRETSMVDKDIIELQNKYIFNHQLEDIKFTDEYHQFNILQAIQGTAIAKITQEFEQRVVGNRVITMRDNTYWRTMPIKSFYSDITKRDIRDSRANIFSDTARLEDLEMNQVRTVQQEVVVVDENGLESVQIQEATIGNYFNIDKLHATGINEELQEYLGILGITKAHTEALNKKMALTKKTGIVQIDECYGMFDLDGDGIAEEVLVVIANESILIRAEATPFTHTRYFRPFIVGRYKVKPNFLYGESNTIKTLPLIRELNATRSMITDSKNFSIFPMTYINSATQIDWDGTWRPMGVIKGMGPNPIEPIINPNNSAQGLNDAALIQRDMDEVWSLAPIQQGTSDRRHLPETARQTNALIAQNEYPLDNIVISKVDNELKPFIEMLFERNMIFKDPTEMVTVLNEDEIREINVEQMGNGEDVIQQAKIKILGNMKLSQERANAEGYEKLLGLSERIPNLARRIDFKKLTDKLLASYGIFDDSKEIFLPETVVQEVLAQEERARNLVQQMAQQLQQVQQVAQGLAQQNDQLKKQLQAFEGNQSNEEVLTHMAKKRIDLEAERAAMEFQTNEKTKERIAEAEIELRTGKRVN